MRYIRHSGYDGFICIADKCPENCCEHWQILTDEPALEKYRTLIDRDDRIRKGINFEEGCFNQVLGRCCFLDEDDLCYLQRTYGEEILCETCRKYPRHVEEFENVREYSLSLSCPEAARILLNREGPMEFSCREDDEYEEFEDFDCLLFDRLYDVREKLFSLARDRSLSLMSRLTKIQELGEKLQEYLEDGRLFELEEVFDRLCSTAVPLDLPLEERSFSVLYELEMLHGDWRETLDRTRRCFFSSGSEKTLPAFLEFAEKHAVSGEQILMLYLYTYFCGAVYDGYVSSKTALAVFSVKWIFFIAFAAGGTKEALIKASYQFARETEHSDLNLDMLEEWFCHETM